MALMPTFCGLEDMISDANQAQLNAGCESFEHETTLKLQDQSSALKLTAFKQCNPFEKKGNWLRVLIFVH